MNLFQGNTYNLKVRIYTCDRTPIVIEDIETIEFSLGTVKKTFTQETLLTKEDYIIVPLSQEDTFSLKGTIRYQVRVKFKNGTVTCSRQVNSRIYDSISEEVL